ncbi:MAG: response regulator [Ignavibacteriales bacterium]|nr:MAG: response regulator [Ignavibacteriales bacterium]
MKNKTNATVIQFIYDQEEPIEKKKQLYLKQQAEENLILPLRVMSLLILLSGIFAMVFEVRYFAEHSVQVYIVRLTATLLSFVVLAVLYSRLALARPVLLVHVLLLTIVLSSGYMILLIPSTLVLNSQIVGLMIFTSALFLSWDVRNQIITALYYYLVFAGAILLNDRSIYFLPNTFESVLFVGFMAFISVIGSAVNFRLRGELAEKSVRVILSERKFRSIIEQSAEGIFQTSPEGKFLTVNPALARILGYGSEQELMEMENIVEIYADPFERAALISQVLEQKEVRDYRLKLKRRDGEIITVLLNDRVVQDEVEQRYYFEGSLRDITAQEMLEQQRSEAEANLLREKNRADELAREALKSAEIKSQFLANMSHEIRTPINGILGFLGLVENKSYRSEQELKEFVSSAKSSAETLLDLINDILDFSKIEAGKMFLEQKPFRIQKVLAEAVSMVSPRANEKGLKIATQIKQNTTGQLVGDAVRLRQVYVNLLSNAVKFTQSGGIKITVNIEKIDEDNVRLTSSVADSGIGIDPEKLPHLFQPFSQLDGSYARKFGGTGLGLAICRQILNLMNGGIRAESEKGKGSTFTFWAMIGRRNQPAEKVITHILPGAEEKPLQQRALTSVEIRSEELRVQRGKYTILLAEDNPVNKKVVMRVLTDSGFNADSVSNGIEAINALGTPGKYHLILMDVQMPVMDGLTATGMIRELENSYSRIPVIALTAHALSGDREKCISAGMDDYITKPIRNDELISAIDRHLRIDYSNLLASDPEPVTAPEEEKNGTMIFDRVHFGAISLDNPEFQKDLMQTFIQDCGRRVDNLHQAIEDHNQPVIISESHTIKGSAFSIGAMQLGELAKEIEEHARGDNNLGKLTVLGEKIRTGFSHLSREVRDIID